MGLESLPHLALGNTTKGMTQVVVGNGAPQHSYSDWLSDQAEGIKENAHQNSRYATARYVQNINALCRKSSVFTPTIKSLSYFSEVDGIVGARRKEQKLLPVKNPVAFGAAVYETAKNLSSAFGANISYYAPSDFVGLEMAEKGLLIEESLNINYKSTACTEYANKYESVFSDLNDLLKKTSSILKVLSKGVLNVDIDIVGEAVCDVIDAYNSSVRVSIETGLSYTIIEDAWLKKRVGASTELAEKMLQLYTYAEAHSLVYKTPYPNYKKEAAEVCMKRQVTQMSVDHYALYSEVFSRMRTEEVVSSAGNVYQIGYMIPHMVYMSILMEDLRLFKRKIETLESLETLIGLE